MSELAVVNLEFSFVFLANPHTASRATTTALLKLPGSMCVANHHAQLIDVTQVCQEAKRCKTVFQTVRHPLDWLVSRYFCNGGERGEWKTWLRKRKRNSIFHRFRTEASHFATYENLEYDLLLLVGRDVTLTRIAKHKTHDKPNDYMSMWDEEDIAWAKQYFPLDFENYGYD